MQIDLKPCPFCGGKASLIKYSSGFESGTTLTACFYIKCTGCNISTSNYKSEIYIESDGTIAVNHNGAEEAVKHWNRRRDADSN